MTWLDWLKHLAPVALGLALAAWGVSLVEDMKTDAHKQGYEQAATLGDAAVSALETKYAQEAAEAARRAEASAKAAAKRQAELQAQNDHLASQLATQQRTHRTNTDRLIGEITRVNDLYRESLDAPPQPLPVAVFTVGFVRVWDEATGARTAMPAAEDPGRAAAQGAEGRAAEQLDSGVSQSQLLEHHVRYAEQCLNTATQLDLLIDAVQGNR